MWSPEEIEILKQKGYSEIFSSSAYGKSHKYLMKKEGLYSIDFERWGIGMDGTFEDQTDRIFFKTFEKLLENI